MSFYDRGSVSQAVTCWYVKDSHKIRHKNFKIELVVDENDIHSLTLVDSNSA